MGRRGEALREVSEEDGRERRVEERCGEVRTGEER